MLLKDAVAESTISAARGYTAEGKCVCSVAFYGGTYQWIDGSGGSWSAKWSEIPEAKTEYLSTLDFRPSGPPVPNVAEAKAVFAGVELEQAEDSEEDLVTGLAFYDLSNDATETSPFGSDSA